MNPIGVAIVGCGRISDLHQLGYQDRKDAKIIAVCDSKKSRVRQPRTASSNSKMADNLAWTERLAKKYSGLLWGHYNQRKLAKRYVWAVSPKFIFHSKFGRCCIIKLLNVRRKYD